MLEAVVLPSCRLQIELITQRELTLLLDLSAATRPARDTLITDIRHVEALANLHKSLSWVVQEVEALRQTRLRDYPDYVYLRLSTQYNLDDSDLRILRVLLAGCGDSEPMAYLGQNLESDKFGTILRDLQELADRCLFTLHAELRCRCFYYIDMALVQDNYVLVNEAAVASGYLESLNADVHSFYEHMTGSLGEEGAL